MTADAVPLRRPDNRAARVKQRDLARALKLAQRANMPIHSMRLEPDGVVILIFGKPKDGAHNLNLSGTALDAADVL
jgi:hypothetical protein